MKFKSTIFIMLTIILLVAACGDSDVRFGMGLKMQRRVKSNARVYEYWESWPVGHTMSGGNRWVVVKARNGRKIEEITYAEADKRIGTFNAQNKK